MNLLFALADLTLIDKVIGALIGAILIVPSILSWRQSLRNMQTIVDLSMVNQRQSEILSAIARASHAEGVFEGRVQVEERARVTDERAQAVLAAAALEATHILGLAAERAKAVMAAAPPAIETPSTKKAR